MNTFFIRTIVFAEPRRGIPYVTLWMGPFTLQASEFPRAIPQLNYLPLHYTL